MSWELDDPFLAPIPGGERREPIDASDEPDDLDDSREYGGCGDGGQMQHGRAGYSSSSMGNRGWSENSHSKAAHHQSGEGHGMNGHSKRSGHKMGKALFGSDNGRPSAMEMEKMEAESARERAVSLQAQAQQVPMQLQAVAQEVGRPFAYKACFQYRLQFTLDPAVPGMRGVHTIHISREELAKDLSRKLANTGAWYQGDPAEMLHHAYICGAKGSIESRTWSTAPVPYSLALVSNVQALNEQVFRSASTTGESLRHINAMAFHSGIGLESKFKIMTTYHHHEDPRARGLAYHHRMSGLRSFVVGEHASDEFVVFAKKSFYGKTFFTVMQQTTAENAQILQKFIDPDFASAQLRKILNKYPGTKIDLEESIIMFTKSFFGIIMNKVYDQLRVPLNMFNQGLSFHLTSTVSDSMAVNDLDKHIHATDANFTPVRERHVAIANVHLWVAFPLF